MGSVQFPLLNILAKQIWQWCEARELWIFASYIRSKENLEADFESRHSNLDTEWELSHEIFSIVRDNFGHPDIDLFASRINKKCVKYVSWHKDPFAWNIDAFTIKWKDFFFYAFPPFSQILKATGIVIFPIWPSQAWYPVMKSLLVSNILTFGPSEGYHGLIHPMHSHLTLGAGILSGNR